MIDAEDANKDDKKRNTTALSKIEPVKIQAESSDEKPSEIKDISVEERIRIEKSLISATMLLLKEYGIRKSGAAVRDAVDISHKYIGPKEA